VLAQVVDPQILVVLCVDGDREFLSIGRQVEDTLVFTLVGRDGFHLSVPVQPDQRVLLGEIGPWRVDERAGVRHGELGASR
jgi:hypothetical protein